MTKPRFSKADRLKIAKAFKDAKAFLWDGNGIRPRGKQTFICFALEEAMFCGTPAYDAYQSAISVIALRLRPHTSLTSWLSAQFIPSHDLTCPRLQAHRLAWLDLLIKEFSK